MHSAYPVYAEPFDSFGSPFGLFSAAAAGKDTENTMFDAKRYPWGPTPRDLPVSEWLVPRTMPMQPLRSDRFLEPDLNKIDETQAYWILMSPPLLPLYHEPSFVRPGYRVFGRFDFVEDVHFFLKRGLRVGLTPGVPVSPDWKWGDESLMEGDMQSRTNSRTSPSGLEVSKRRWTDVLEDALGPIWDNISSESVIVYLSWPLSGSRLFPVEIPKTDHDPSENVSVRRRRYKSASVPDNDEKRTRFSCQSVLNCLLPAIRRWHQCMVESYYQETGHQFQLSNDPNTGITLDDLKLDGILHYRGRRFVAKFCCDKVESQSSCSAEEVYSNKFISRLADGLGSRWAN
ncbi:hypothetical protein K474DRAFT_489684 [Panus rudis PR-1116 ss-1]|nr:hypothetical protein K474DRAFT_489684 [Panus rudis PR-1116 ss-1]